jgi:hypothetical protein
MTTHEAGAHAHAFSLPQACRPLRTQIHLDTNAMQYPWWHDASASQQDPDASLYCITAGSPATKAVAAAVASLPEGFTIQPLEVAKICLQLDKQNKYKNNMTNVIKDIMQTRGWTGLFTGYFGIQYRFTRNVVTAHDALSWCHANWCLHLPQRLGCKRGSTKHACCLVFVQRQQQQQQQQQQRPPQTRTQKPEALAPA